MNAISNDSIIEKSKNVNTNDQNADVNERKSKVPEKNGVTWDDISDRADVDEIYLNKERLE